jgi:hypothetical protein
MNGRRFVMYVRFVTDLRDGQTNQQVGVIRSVCNVEDCIAPADIERLQALFAWFRIWLRVPTRFARSKRRNAQKKAICWFKDSSFRCISRAKEIVTILEKNSIATKTLVTRRPGYIVYEDYHQIAAIPFRDTFVSERKR